MPIFIGISPLVVIGLLLTEKASAARCCRLLCAVSQTEASLTELSQQTACPTAFSNNNSIIRSERLPSFRDLRRSFLASANNVELNQPGIAPTRSENVPESVRRSFLRFTIECPHRRCGPSLPVSGVKQTSPIRAGMSQFDPFQTLATPRRPRLTLSPNPFQCENWLRPLRCFPFGNVENKIPGYSSPKC